VVEARSALTRAAVLLGAFDPPTNAHIDILHAASVRRGIPGMLCLTRVLLARGDDRLLTDGDRVRILEALAEAEGFAFLIARNGTYLEVARELRADGIEGTFVIGSDKLPQLLDPSFYSDGPDGVAATFDEVDFVVVERHGTVPDGNYEVIPSAEAFTDPAHATISATDVRNRLRQGLDVNALVPAVVTEALGRYTSGE
jgi:nicotinic acid mononucleotide adenylyltransferase